MQHAPCNLYRYRPLGSTNPKKEFEEELLERLCSGISNHSLFAADAADLNDPFEGTGVVPYVASMGSSIPINLGFLPPSARDFTRGLRVISMTERYDSPQMWAHYATGYCGVCLCLDTSFLEGHLGAVRYSDVPILEREYRADELCMHRNAFSPTALLVKQRDWAYEQEWRAVIPSEQAVNGFVEYGENDLWAIIIGHNTPNDAIIAIQKACAGSNTHLFVTAPQELKYRLGIWPVGFRPSFDGRTIEQELDEFYALTDLKTFENLAIDNRHSMELAKERVFAEAEAKRLNQ